MRRITPTVRIRGIGRATDGHVAKRQRQASDTMQTVNMRYLGDNVWTAGRWHIIGSDEAKFELWLFTFTPNEEFDPNTMTVKIRTFDTMCDVENFLRTCSNINFEGDNDAN